ncbi:MAG TPA: tetratricopeptide repeat protein [Pirellulales bacterium]|nr:tetratricopeptide repeat protein [Pirellulales bacterium]
MNELDLFAAAVAVADRDQREALLNRECAGLPDLRSRMGRLLEAHFASHPLLDPPAADGARAPPIDGILLEAAGAVISGKYKLLERLGEGGMGSVWMAEQTEPIRRKVAAKLIRVERGQSHAILARFDAERQAIALMDHPHIARLLDAGTTETGSPFFVMELVKGVPLTDYCDTHKLSIPQRLCLFIQICLAVQHAHQKGIIHRDLKPTNILVESHDGKPVPKVIDFGLAKAATGLKLSERTLYTSFGSVIGTPQYMAPEQASFNALDVDTRADIYALGVVLYELLTGTTPLTRAMIKETQLDEMLKLIREQEAPTPSSRLSSSESQPSVAANRKMEPARLGRLVRGELDWIVLKALSKERERRYETASSFARDVERFLNQEAVTAGPPTAAYRLQKFVRRHRPQAIAASLVLLALLAGVIGTTLGLLAANRATDAERTAKNNALEQERLAEAKRREAERNLELAKKGNLILGSVFAGLDPKKIAESGRPLQDVLRQNLTQAVRELEGSALGDPLEVAAMQNTLGNSLLGLGEAALAIEVFERARGTRTARLGPDHPDTLVTMNHLARAYQLNGQLAKSRPLFEETLAKRKTTLGPNHPDTLESMDNLAWALHGSHEFAKAVPLFEETLEKRKATLGTGHSDTLSTMGHLAAAYALNGQIARAVPLYKETLEKRKAALGPDHPDTLESMDDLATAHMAGSQLAMAGGRVADANSQLTEAARLYEEVLQKKKARLGPDHPSTLGGMNNLALAYMASGQLAKSVALFEEVLRMQEAKLGPDHPQTMPVKENLATARLMESKERDAPELGTQGSQAPATQPTGEQ